jgi:hypothetical protein
VDGNDAPRPAVFIVDRHPDVTAEGVFTERGDQSKPWKKPLGNPPVVGIQFAVTAAIQRQAELRLFNFKNHIAVGFDVLVGFRALVHRIFINFEAVHVGHVARIDAAFHCLKIIAFLQSFGDEHVACRQCAPLNLGSRRLLFFRSHVGPDDAGPLNAWVGLYSHALAGLRR